MDQFRTHMKLFLFVMFVSVHFKDLSCLNAMFGGLRDWGFCKRGQSSSILCSKSDRRANFPDIISSPIVMDWTSIE